MKKILEICTQNTPLAMEQVVKLRLRGRGSGFKEGPNQMGKSYIISYIYRIR